MPKRRPFVLVVEDDPALGDLMVSVFKEASHWITVRQTVTPDHVLGRVNPTVNV